MECQFFMCSYSNINEVKTHLQEIIESKSEVNLDAIIENAINNKDYDTLILFRDIIKQNRDQDVFVYDEQPKLRQIILNDDFEMFQYVVNNEIFCYFNTYVCYLFLNSLEQMNKEIVIFLIEYRKKYEFPMFYNYIDSVKDKQFIIWLHQLSTQYTNKIFSFNGANLQALSYQGKIEDVKWWLYEAPGFGISAKNYDLNCFAASTESENPDMLQLWINAIHDKTITMKLLGDKQYSKIFYKPDVIAEYPKELYDIFEELYAEHIEILCNERRVRHCCEHNNAQTLIWLESLAERYPTKCEFKLDIIYLSDPLKYYHIEILTYLKNKMDLNSNPLLVSYAVQSTKNTKSLDWLLENTDFTYDESAIDTASKLGHYYILEWFDEKKLEFKFTFNAIKSLMDEIRCNLGACTHGIYFSVPTTSNANLHDYITKDGIQISDELLFSHLCRYFQLEEIDFNLETLEISETEEMLERKCHNDIHYHFKTVVFWNRKYELFDLGNRLSENSKVFLQSIFHLDQDIINNLNDRYLSCKKHNIIHDVPELKIDKKIY